MSASDLPAANAPATSVAFADAARTIAMATRSGGLATPSFRCPPKVVGVDRAVRRRGRSPQEAVVSVRIKGRPWVAVLADMIEGVVVANRLASPVADRVRHGLWEACGYGVAADTTTVTTADTSVDTSVDLASASADQTGPSSVEANPGHKRVA